MAAPVQRDEELELQDRLARLRRERRRAARRVRRLRARRPAGRHGPRPRDQGAAPPCRGDHDRGARGRAPAGRGAVRALPGLRRLPLPGSRLRGAARGQAGLGRGLAAPDRRHRRPAARADRPAPRSSSATATRWSTRSRRAPTARRSGSTARDAGTRCSGSSTAGSRPTSATGSATPSRDWAREEHLPAYDQADGEGYLRHLIVREGRNTGQALVQLVTHERERFDRERLIEVLTAFPEVRSIHWAVNDTPSEVTNLPDRAPLGRRGDRGGDRRPALPDPAERVPPDEHADGRAALRARARGGGPDRRSRRSTTSTAGSARSGSRSPATR